MDMGEFMDGANIPVMEDVVWYCKELNEKRGVEDTCHNVIEAAMALFTSIAMKPKEKLKPKAGGFYDNIEKESNEQLKRINSINIKLRDAIQEHENLLEQVKKSKEAVVDEYRDALGQFRDIIENPESSGARQFQSILEGVIREVITDADSEEATNGGESPGSVSQLVSNGSDTGQQSDVFASLFQDQQISEIFDYTFAGMDLMQPPNITVTQRTTYNTDTPIETHTPIPIEAPVVTMTFHPDVSDEVPSSPEPCLVPPSSPNEVIPRPPSRPPPATPRRRRTVRPRRREMNL